MKTIVVISEDKQRMLDRLLGNGITVQEIGRLIGIHPETLREKLKRRKRGDANWHNREQVDHRGVYQKAKLATCLEGDSRDDVRIRLFDLTKLPEGVTVAQAAKMTGYSESVCRMELDDFCHRPRRSDVEAICKKAGDRYIAKDWQTNGNHAAKSVEIVKVLRGRHGR